MLSNLLTAAFPSFAVAVRSPLGRWAYVGLCLNCGHLILPASLPCVDNDHWCRKCERRRVQRTDHFAAVADEGYLHTFQCCPYTADAIKEAQHDEFLSSPPPCLCPELSQPVSISDVWLPGTTALLICLLLLHAYNISVRESILWSS